MKVLIVASYNTDRFSPFIIEQANTLSKQGIEVNYYGIIGHGIKGYFSNRKGLVKKIQEFKPDLIHAHYGLSGLLANFQKKVPVVTTYHGSDIHSAKLILLLSKISMRLSKYNIFVSQSLFNISRYKKHNYNIISCGVELSVLYPVDIQEAREKLGWDKNKIYILFSGSFGDPVKNYSLAKKAVDSIENCILVELKGYCRDEVNLLMNASNLQLTTSFRESGPLVVKEAMACNRPVVSTNVGDVKWVMGNIKGYFLTSFDTTDCATQIKKAIQFSVEQNRTSGRERIIGLGLDTQDVAKRLIQIYNHVTLTKHHKIS